MSTRVGFIGLGSIGKPMAINVAEAGFDLMVYDLREEPLQELAGHGAKVARSAREIGAHGEVIELVVVDDAQVEAVVLGEDGILNGAKPGSVIAVHSTVNPKTVQKVAEIAKTRNVTVIDAPISGGPQGASAKSLCYMIGGNKEAFERCRPIFTTSGANLFHLGDLGNGEVAKLAHNLIVFVNSLAASEGMRLAEKAGIAAKTFQEVVHVSAGQSRVADTWLQQRNLRKTYTTGLQGLIQLIHKDLGLALELGHDLGVGLPGTGLTQQLIERVLEID